MNIIHSRIDLSKTNYQFLKSWKFLETPDYDLLAKIYYEYCEYKKFDSVLPFFLEYYKDTNRDIIGYYDEDNLVAFSLILKYPSVNSVMSEQFAWNYENPKLFLGIKSLENECAIYKNLGYRYLYLGEHQEYKSKFSGYEILGRPSP